MDDALRYYSTPKIIHGADFIGRKREPDIGEIGVIEVYRFRYKGTFGYNPVGLHRIADLERERWVFFPMPVGESDDEEDEDECDGLERWRP